MKLYRPLFGFETVRADDEYSLQSQPSGEWKNSGIWQAAERGGWNGYKARDCKGCLSGLRFKMRRRIL